MKRNKINKINIHDVLYCICLSALILFIIVEFIVATKQVIQKKNIMTQIILAEGEECYIFLLDYYSDSNYMGMILDSDSLSTIENMIFKNEFILDTDRLLFDSGSILGDNFEEQNVIVDTSYINYPDSFEVSYVERIFVLPSKCLWRCFYYKGNFYAIEAIQNIIY